MIFGNGVITTNTYDPATGRVQAITTGRSGNPTGVQNLAYQWDAVGNLTQRQDLNRSLTESFTYDALNRLTQTALNSLVTETLRYDALGNIQQKTVNSTTTAYVYDLAAGPHALTALQNASGVTTASYTYDANGNLTSGGGRSLTWNAANYPVQITQGTHTTGFTYGPDRQRVTQTETQSGTLIQTTVSIGALFEQTTTATGDITYRHFIRAGSQTIAIHTRTSDYTQQTVYLHRDHLGSISAITNEDGDLVASMSFSAFGERRDPETWQGSATNPAANTTDRGYTGHKMLDGVGLIHMNGRVYDPGIGRFVSADPIIQAPFYSQSYNRYSYVWNNPLSNTDPSGFVTNRDDGCNGSDTGPECSTRAQFEMKKCQRQGLDCKFEKDDQGQWRAVGTTHSLITVATARAAGVIAGYVKPDITFGSAVGAGPGEPLTEDEITELRRVQKNVAKLTQQPEESALDFFKRVAKQAYKHREDTGFEACTKICADDKGVLTTNLVTQGSRIGCLPESCPSGTNWIGKGIHSHGKDGRTTLTDRIFNSEISHSRVRGIEQDELSKVDRSNNMNDGLAIEDGIIWEF